MWQLIERKIQETPELSRELATTLALSRLYRWHAELYTVENCGGEGHVCGKKCDRGKKSLSNIIFALTKKRKRAVLDCDQLL